MILQNLYKSRNQYMLLGGAEMIELGGNITLAGFKELDHAELIVVKKITGSYGIGDLHTIHQPIHSMVV